MRLRTIPVSLAGVATAAALGLICHGSVRGVPLTLCIIFAVLAQIASNFANEYFDYRDGLDRPGREGFRRGVTEGDISPRAMLTATLLTLALALGVGCGLICYGGWWLVAVGAAVGMGVLAYSAGPYPLSRHGLGEVAVIVFFGLVPVTLTYWLSTGQTPGVTVWCAAAGIGLLGANVLVVNNYRDRHDDAAVGKHTLAVLTDAATSGRFSVWQYTANALLGMGLTCPAWWAISPWMLFVPVAFFCGVVAPLCRRISRESSGRALNPLLGATARAMALYALTLLAAALACTEF
ncbi:MAG: 1,4-dihydroxy-2-naphthoate octaprenyltransferase [Candidatus Amulumruptor caecigallinarius]|nr:1,4-dihydroxy-2-naphthoate octaprenyltransferase [Candidatus Amulumruptor caecigallinarius]MCM1396573.1 1,4-dihydroxy-2-naphthoate octaprenyltransferase [Candidatus Amulumruptor caecigallinarius]